MSFLRKMKREIKRVEQDIRKIVNDSSDESDDEDNIKTETLKAISATSSDNIESQSNPDSSSQSSDKTMSEIVYIRKDSLRDLLKAAAEEYNKSNEPQPIIIRENDEVFPQEMTMSSFISYLKREWDDYKKENTKTEEYSQRNEEMFDYVVNENSLTAIHETYESVQAEINADPWRNDVERDFPPTHIFEEIKEEMKLLDKYEGPLDHDYDEENIFDQLEKEKEDKFRTEVVQEREIRRRKTRPLVGPYKDFYDYRSQRNGHALILYHPGLKPKKDKFSHLLTNNLTFNTSQMTIKNWNHIENNLESFFRDCESDSDGDCLMIVILTYGYVDNTGHEIINCGDNTWINSSDLLWHIDKYQSTNFTNKPKIIIQVGWPCEMMKSKGLESDDAGERKPKILNIYNPKNLPSMSHLCIVSAIPEGSGTATKDKDKELASRFVDNLIEEFVDFRSEQHQEMDWELMSVLTQVNRKLSNGRIKRSISVLSTLTAAFDFKMKEP